MRCSLVVLQPMLKTGSSHVSSLWQNSDYDANLDSVTRYIILQRHKQNDTDPVSATTTRPARRKRQRSVFRHGSEAGTYKEEEPQVDTGVNPYAVGFADSMDTLLNDDIFDDALNSPNTFDEMLSDTSTKLEESTSQETDYTKCEYMEIAYSDQDSLPDLSETSTSTDSTPTPGSTTSDDSRKCINPVDCFGGDQWTLDNSIYGESDETETRRPINNFFPDDSLDSWSVSSQAELDSPVPSIEDYTNVGGFSRESKMVLEHMQPELVERVLSLVLTSKSPIDVKIYGQEERFKVEEYRVEL